MDKGGAEKEPEPQHWFFLCHITTKIYGKKIATKEGVFLYKQLLFLLFKLDLYFAILLNCLAVGLIYID